MHFSGKQNDVVFYPPMYMFRNLKNELATRKETVPNNWHGWRNGQIFRNYWKMLLMCQRSWQEDSVESHLKLLMF